MFFSSRKDAKAIKALELVIARNDSENEVRDAFESAKAISDPADKVLRLDGVKWDISRRQSALRTEIFDKASKIGFRVGMGILAAVSTGAVWTNLAGAMTVSGGIMYGGFIAVVLGSVKSWQSAQKRLEKKASGHIARLEGMQKQASGLVSHTMKNNVQAIASSPRCSRIFDSWRLKEEFQAAVASEIQKGGAVTLSFRHRGQTPARTA